MKTTYQTGVSGEKAAEEYLCTEKHMKVIARRYRVKCGEIDLIMLDGDYIVFAEVKTRLSAYAGYGLAAVDARKQKRISQAARIWLMTNGAMNSPVRFDVVEVNSSGIIHIPDAFQPGGMFFH